MKISLKIDPYNYPIVIIASFVIGFIIAIALGFSPQHGSGQSEQHLILLPAFLPWLLPRGKIQ